MATTEQRLWDIRLETDPIRRIRAQGGDGDLDAYGKWIDSQIKRLDSLLPVCEEVGIYVLIDIMEEYDWDWAYHAFREWDGWSVEHGPDNNDRSLAAEPTDRQKLLTGWFEKNKR